MKLVFSLKDQVHGGDAPLKFCWQTVSGNYLATTGQDNVVRIWDRHGHLIEEIQLPGSCTGLQWDVDGDILCAISDRSSQLFMWNSTQKKTFKVDSGAKDSHSFLAWSKKDFHLAIGTVKGNLILYNHKLGRKIPVLGKHSKKIVCGEWNANINCLALGAEDKIITISDTSGQTLQQFSVTDQPSMISFSELKGSNKSQLSDITISMVLGRKTLFLYKLNNPDGPSQLAFQPKYGKIESYCWYGDNYIMLGFSHGHLVAISTHPNEIGKEIFHVRNHHNYLSSIAVSSSLNFAASCGDNNIHIHDLQKLEEVTAIITIEDCKGLRELSWTSDGQLLAVTTTKGHLHCYLTKLPMLGDVYGTRIAYLTSLLEVTVFNPIEEEEAIIKKIDIEPSFVACGPHHLATGMNNRAWFYFVSDEVKKAGKTRDREYLGTIEHMSLNSNYAAVMFDGKVQLHMIDESVHEALVEGKEAKLFPSRDEDGNITCCDLTEDFLVYGTQSGNLYHFYLSAWSEVNVFKHGVPIRSIYPNQCGTHIAIIDDKGDGILYNPVADSIHKIPDLTTSVKGVLWETHPFDKDIFIIYNKKEIFTYIFHRESIEGSFVSLVGQTRLPFSQRPLLVNNGTVTLQSSSGKINYLLLDTHSFLSPDISSLNEQAFESATQLKRWKEAWTVCVEMDSDRLWDRLGQAAMMSLDVELAIRVYRQLKDAGMVLSLEKLRDSEDRNMLAGTIASYMGQFDRAQDLLLSSANPISALHLRRDLMQWDTALQLASRLDPDQIPFIAKEYGQQLEFTGNYSAAYEHFEKGLIRSDEWRSHDEACVAGLARTSLRLGNIRRGVEMALKHPSRQLKKDCAAILENMRQFAESANLYEVSEYFDKAAVVYIRAKNWNKVGELLPKVTSIRIHLQYAKAKEADNKYAEAADAYHNAKDYENEIRMCLDHLRDPERAVNIVKSTASTEGAKMVANFFIKLGDYGSAIQFLVLSNCNDEAFYMAKKHGQMEVYAEIIGENASSDDLMSIALHFENEKDHLMAGKFFARCSKYAKALNHYMRCSLGEDGDEVLQLAVEAVAAAQDVQLTRILSEYLLGEHDGVPKDPNYLFRMYMALGQYAEAAQTAIIISKEEQINGQYRVAHKLLFGMMKELKLRQIKIPSEMENNLLILHTYILVKWHIKRGNHNIAARLLVRVAENISKFPSHIVQLLTTTVIECHKSKLKHSSFSYAAMLMRPEYRTKVDVKYKKKIEQIVRKTGSQVEDEEEDSTPCPYCDFDLLNFELVCSSCRNNVPYCIATGRHISKTDVTTCPSCNFPAIYSEFQTFLEQDSTCPMCLSKINSDDLLKVKNVAKILPN